jgi:hypothetical protein
MSAVKNELPHIDENRIRITALEASKERHSGSETTWKWIASVGIPLAGIIGGLLVHFAR